LFHARNYALRVTQCQRLSRKSLSYGAA
jgi:hypothetical protein